MSWGPNYPGKQQGTQRDANTPDALDALLKRSKEDGKWDEGEEGTTPNRKHAVL